MSLSTTRFGGNTFGLPAPAPLPNLRDALAMRASIFGPADHDEVRATPKGWRTTLGAVLRRLADRLQPEPNRSYPAPILYAHAGEEIFCEAGHVVTRPTRDLYLHEVIFGDMLEGMDHLNPGNPTRGIPGDEFPLCPCGGRWNWFGAMRFQDGFRVFRNGAIRHVTLDEVGR